MYLYINLCVYIVAVDALLDCIFAAVCLAMYKSRFFKTDYGITIMRATGVYNTLLYDIATVYILCTVYTHTTG